MHSSPETSAPLGRRNRLFRLLFVLTLAIGVGARVWQFGSVPCGINQDEAFAAYEAWSLLRTGLDTSGYSFPVYLTTWGSGMSVLQTCFMIPLIALFGLKVWVIRLPQLIISVLSLPAAYSVLKRMAGRRAGLFGMFLMAIAPWHIFLSRWALDATNLAPGFLLFGLCFFLRGLEEHRFFLLSALMYGLSLYCYAAVWPFVPLILLAQAGYALWCGQLRFRGRDGLWIGLSVLVLFGLALPLLLFVAVNLGMMEEIRLPYLSIPRLVYFRNGDLSLKALPEHLKALLHLLFYQTDGLPGNATERFGLIYYGTTPFFLIGAVLAAKQLAKSLRTRQLQPLPFLLIQLMAALLQGLSIPPNVNRVNILWPPVILLAAAGICALCRWIGGPRALLLPVLFYLALFARFELYYFGEYASSVTGYYADGLQDAVAAAAAHPGTICVSPSASYPRILFYTAQDPDEYRATVQYSNYPSAFLDVAGFGRFSFSFDPSQPDSSCVYLLDRSVDLEPLCSAGFTIEQYGGFSVAYHP